MLGTTRPLVRSFPRVFCLFRRASTLLNLGACSDRLGLLADALRYWREGTALLESADPRLAFAKQRVVELDARVPRLRVDLAAEIPVGTVITLDDVAVTRDELADEMRLDAGSHRFELDAPGHASASVEVHLSERTHETVKLELGHAPPTPAQTFLAVAEPSDSRSVWGFVAAGLGFSGIAAGAITGGLVLDRKTTVDELCGAHTCSSQAGVDAATSGRDLAIASSVSFAVGGAATLASIVLLATTDWSPDAGDGAVVVPAVSPGFYGLTLQGAFLMRALLTAASTMLLMWSAGCEAIVGANFDDRIVERQAPEGGGDPIGQAGGVGSNGSAGGHGGSAPLNLAEKVLRGRRLRKRLLRFGACAVMRRVLASAKVAPSPTTSAHARRVRSGTPAARSSRGSAMASARAARDDTGSVACSGMRSPTRRRGAQHRPTGMSSWSANIRARSASAVSCWPPPR